MRSIDTVIIGAGQAGLATSWYLTRLGHDHVVLDRGRVGERWMSERWDSLRTLTPNWMSRLPGHRYEGPDPDGYMRAADLARYLDGYARSFGAPVETHTAVERVHRVADRFVVRTDRGTWRARNVVVASGWCDTLALPRGIDPGPIDPDVLQVPATHYRNPTALPSGAVVVVGASASGTQIADELARAGRDVVLAVGAHTRVPRRYRGRDIFGWLEDLGELDRGLNGNDDRRASEPSLQLVGNDEGRDLHLGTLRDRGVTLVGRLTSAERHQVRFAPGLGDTVAAADDRLMRLIDRIDALAPPAGVTERPTRLHVDDGVDRVDLRRRGVAAIVWATGYRRRYPWLDVPVLDGKGEIRHNRGVTDVPGLYVMGMRFQSRRRSTFIDGVRFDAAHVAAHLVGFGRALFSRESIEDDHALRGAAA